MRTLPIKIMLLFGLLLLAACSAQPTITPAPTQDLSAFRTEVAATVFAQVALTPSATLAPTQTPPPTATATKAPSDTPAAAVSTTPGTPAATAETNDLAKWVAQTVADGSHFQPGQDFTLVWRLQNSGTTTWNNQYVLRFFGGDALGAPNEIALDKDVAPGETVDFTLKMKAPKVPGSYTSSWVMSNQVRRNFKESVFLKIVVDTPTATPTATKVVTPTVTILPPSVTPTK